MLFRSIGPGEAPPPADLIVLPGSKAVRADLEWLRAGGWDTAIERHLRYGGKVIGLCGGYQMLGRVIRDPAGFEGPPGACDGLGLLDVETTLSDEKRLEPVHGTSADGAPFSGYEMHMGVTEGPDRARPFAQFADGSAEGAVSADGQVVGTYVHGLFADDRQRAAWLARFAAGGTSVAYETQVEDTLDRLAEHIARYVDLDRLLTLAR